jgi:hypothetical protein
LPPHDPTKVLVRPGTLLETSAVTKNEVERFHPKSSLLRNKLFLDKDGDTGADMSSSRLHKRLLYKVIGLMFTYTSDTVTVRIESSPVTDEVSIHPLLKRIVMSRIVG